MALYISLWVFILILLILFIWKCSKTADVKFEKEQDEIRENGKKYRAEMQNELDNATSIVIGGVTFVRKD